MAQPKDPPLSIRPGAVRLSLIDAHAKQRGITRHAAVLDLIDAGLPRRRGPIPAPIRTVRDIPPETMKRLDAPFREFGPQRARPGSRLKAESKPGKGKR